MTQIKTHFDTGWKCPSCGGNLTTETYSEATITYGECGYSWASHFGGGEPQIEPCKTCSQDKHVV